MQLTQKLSVAAPASGVRPAPARPVVARRGAVVVKAAATAPAPVVADNATVDKCVNAVRFLAIGTFFCWFLSLVGREAPTTTSVRIRAPLARPRLPADAAARAVLGPDCR